MERVTTRIPKRQVNSLEALVEQGEFPNRSEAIRAFVREGLKEFRERGHHREVRARGD